MLCYDIILLNENHTTWARINQIQKNYRKDYAIMESNIPVSGQTYIKHTCKRSSLLDERWTFETAGILINMGDTFFCHHRTCSVPLSSHILASHLRGCVCVCVCARACVIVSLSAENQLISHSVRRWRCHSLREHPAGVRDCLPWMHTHTHTRTRTRTHTHPHTRTKSGTHAHACAHTRMHTHARTHAHFSNSSLMC